eukprot:GFUD01060025.1.p1 GENE.GFUD01060025.1~~GFUD01060025.1.p1  ORF type:complete len:660 (-),score=270.52 GFUD01060025.1:77-2056(-)
MSERRIITRDNFGFGGNDFKVVINKSEESMEEGELSEDDADPGWNAPRATVMARLGSPDILGDLSVDDRRVVEREEVPENMRESLVKRMPFGRMEARKRKVAWKDANGTQMKNNFHISNLKQNIRNIVEENEKNKKDSGYPSEKVETFIEMGKDDALNWETKLKRPRMGMVADMVERRVPAKNRLHSLETREIIKRKVSNQQIEKRNQLGVKEVERTNERNVVMTEVVEKEEEEGFTNIVRTIKFTQDDTEKTAGRLEGRLGREVRKTECGRPMSKAVYGRDKKMKERLGRMVGEDDSVYNLENDNGEDLPEWDEKILIQVPQNELAIGLNNERRREVMEEINRIEVTKQRDKNRQRKEDLLRKEETRKIEEMRKKENYRLEKELRNKEELKFKEAEMRIEELRRQEELMKNKMRIVERQKEIEEEKRELEKQKQVKETEHLIKKKKLENDARVREEIRLVEEKERKLIQDRKSKDRRKAEKLREERRQKDKKKEISKQKYKNIKTERKPKRRYSTSEDSSSESDSESSSSSESDTDSSETESDDSEYEQQRRKNKSRSSNKDSVTTKKGRLLEIEKHIPNTKEMKEQGQTKSYNKETTTSSSKGTPKPKEEPRFESKKEERKEEKKQSGEEPKKAGELTDKLKSYLNRAKEAKENKKK